MPRATQVKSGLPREFGLIIDKNRVARVTRELGIRSIRRFCKVEADARREDRP